MTSNSHLRTHSGRLSVAMPIAAVLIAVLACSPAPSTPTPPLQV
ncbi:MAG: hypothetical protein HW375_2303, partial [Anaerolineales bacterium]|nr:hypothetical protein [Anaerolineales bacterium]